MARKLLCIGEVSRGQTQVAGVCLKCGQFAELQLGICQECLGKKKSGKVKASELEEIERWGRKPSCVDCEYNSKKRKCPATGKHKAARRLRKEREEHGRCSKWIPKWDPDWT